MGGLTGEQLSLLRDLEDERRCEFEDELERRCPDDKAKGSRFCGFHTPEQDDYDCWVDKEFDDYGSAEAESSAPSTPGAGD